MSKARKISLPARINKLSTRIWLSLKKLGQKILTLIEKKPLTAFFAALGLLLILIVIGNFLRKPNVQTVSSQPELKTVDIYNLGETQTITAQAKVEKSSVVQIVALTGGIVSKINVSEGQKVAKGTSLISLSSNYNGANAASVSRQIAQKQNENVIDTYNLQKDLIKNQKDLADKNLGNFEKLRDITNESVGETQNLVTLNEQIVSSIDNDLLSLETNNVDGANDALILQTKELKSQFVSATNAIRQGLRNSQYQAGTDNNPTGLAQLGRDLTRRQLELQDKAIDLNRDISTLQLKLAQISESLMYPSSPFEGTVERINVTVGQNVNPGTILATVSAPQQKTKLTALVTRNIARNASSLDPSILTVENKEYQLLPQYISKEATDDQLYSITYLPNPEIAENLTNHSYVEIKIPQVSGNINGEIYIPLDSVHQTQEESFVFTYKDGTIESKKVTLGPVLDNFVKVEDGISLEDKIVLNRNVVAGDKVKI